MSPKSTYDDLMTYELDSLTASLANSNKFLGFYCDYYQSVIKDGMSNISTDFPSLGGLPEENAKDAAVRLASFTFHVEIYARLTSAYLEDLKRERETETEGHLRRYNEKRNRESTQSLTECQKQFEDWKEKLTSMDRDFATRFEGVEDLRNIRKNSYQNTFDYVITQSPDNPHYIAITKKDAWTRFAQGAKNRARRLSQSIRPASSPATSS